MHPNTKWIMAWADRMNLKHGSAPPGNDWCRALAYFMDEAGNDHPSTSAIATAVKWEKEPPKRCCSCHKILVNPILDACAACSS